MRTSWTRTTSTLAVLATLLYEPVAHAAVSGTGCDTSVPTQLVGPIAPPERPVPICRRCQVVVAPTSDDSAELRLWYLDDPATSFSGTIEIVVWLADGEERVVTVTDVLLQDDTQATYALEPGDDWSWSEVVYAWVELVPEP